MLIKDNQNGSKSALWQTSELEFGFSAASFVAGRDDGNIQANGVSIWFRDVKHEGFHRSGASSHLTTLVKTKLPDL